MVSILKGEQKIMVEHIIELWEWLCPLDGKERKYG